MPRKPKPAPAPEAPAPEAQPPAEVVAEAPSAEVPAGEAETPPVEPENDQGDEEATAFENGDTPGANLPVVEDVKPDPPPAAPPPPGPIVAPEGYMLARVLDVATRPARRKPFVFVVSYASETGVEFVREYDKLDTTQVKPGAKVFVPVEGA